MLCPWSVRRVKGLMWAVHGLCAGLRVRVEGFWTSIKADDVALLLLFSPSYLSSLHTFHITFTMSSASDANASSAGYTSYPSLQEQIHGFKVSFHL
jgi:hypothetical protein